ncbi:MAG: enoyl-CoA hydratase/isomerase family protein [Dehalococcoidia bacterium]
MPLLTTRTEGSVLVVELQRAERGNALNRQLQRELSAAWQDFEDRDELKVAVLAGSPDVFSIGHDVAELASGTGEDASPVPDPGIFPMSLSKPVIAAVEGPCYGLGFELALACDLRVAGEDAIFGIPDLDLAAPYRVASVLLPRMTFMGQSAELMFSGKTLDARTANARRLVNTVTPKGQALATAVSAATSMVQHFGDAGAFRKREIWGLSGVPLPYAMTVVRETGPGAFR